MLPAEMVSRRMLVLQLAYILDRTLVVRPYDEPKYPEPYLPLGSVTYADIASHVAKEASFDIEQRDKVVRFNFSSFWANNRLRSYFFPWAPPSFGSSKCPRMMFDGETLSRLRLSGEMTQRLQHVKDKIWSDQPVIGLYLGRGSELAAEEDAPLAALLNQVNQIQSTQGVQRVIVFGAAVDDHAAIGDASGYEFAELDDDPPNPSSAILELELLSACDWIVGRVTADASRIAAARSGVRVLRCDRHRLVACEPERRTLGRLFGKR